MLVGGASRGPCLGGTISVYKGADSAVVRAEAVSADGAPGRGLGTVSPATCFSDHWSYGSPHADLLGPLASSGSFGNLVAVTIKVNSGGGDRTPRFQKKPQAPALKKTPSET